MSSPAVPPISDASGIRYPSLAALQAAHNDLLKRQREQSENAGLSAEVMDFLRQATATGALLDADDDRRAGQSMLDYWVARLYRIGEEPPVAGLAEFDLLLALVLPNELCPYVGLDAFREDDTAKFFARAR